MTRRGGPLVWVLNLDAERELAQPATYRRSRETESRVACMAQELRTSLCAPGDLVLDGDPDRPARGLPGRCWCPTPSALEHLRKAGAEPPGAPALPILQRVNHRRFAVELGPRLAGARFIDSARELEAHLAGDTPSGWWLLKRPFGFAGTGRRRVRASRLEPDDARWIAASLRRDGLQVEPWCEDVIDFALHGYLAASGACWLGEPCRQVSTPQGAWLRTERTGELSAHERSQLVATGRAVAEALGAAGYFGPFGVDAFRHRRGFHPLSEINARYTMGWAIGMGAVRPDR